MSPSGSESWRGGEVAPRGARVSLLLGLLASASAWAAASPAPREVKVLLIINRSNEVDELPFEAVRKLFLAEKTFWKESKPVRLYALEPGKHKARDVVLEKIYRMDEKKYKKYWALRIFKGEVSSEPFEKTEEQMVREIGGEESGLGYIEGAAFEKLPPALREKIKVIQIDGKKHTDKDYPLLVSAP